MKRKIQIVGLVMLTIFFLGGCATLGLKPWVDRTPDEKALTILQTYNEERKDTFDQATKMIANPAGYTETEKQINRDKKAVLVKLRPLVKIYKDIVFDGGVPDKATEQEIIDLLRQLGRQL